MKRKIVNINPDVVSGVPVFSGTRVPVQTFFDYLEEGRSAAEFRQDFPGISEQMLRQFITQLAASSTRELIHGKNFT